MKELICLYPEAVPTQFIDYVNELAEKLQPVDAFIGKDVLNRKIDSEYRKSEVRWMLIEMQEHFTIKDTILYYAKQANRNYFGFDIDYVQDIQHTTYKADEQGNGKYDWHIDTFWNGPTAFDRKVSLTIQLSDSSDYEGGDFEIEGHYPDTNMLRQKGTVIVFPSFLRHRVTPITRGIRKSLVSWVEGPKFR